MALRHLMIYAIIACAMPLFYCAGMPNALRPLPEHSQEGGFFTASDGAKLFLHEQTPAGKHDATIYVIAGITGINHKNERDLISLLVTGHTRVVVVHPRGTGFSEGKRGDVGNFKRIIEDYAEVIHWDQNRHRGKIILYAHSMSCAIALELAAQKGNVDGLVLINPPLRLKTAKGMSPAWTDYIKYAWYYIFAPHTPIVNMAGDPALIADADDRREAEERANDRLLVKYFSMHAMTEAQKIMQKMPANAQSVQSALLLVCGDRDNIIELSGCEEIFSLWPDRNKTYRLIPDGPHGKKTALTAAPWVKSFIASLPKH